MSVAEASRASLERQLEPLVTREISGIAAIDTAIAHEAAPDYVVMFQDAKNGKQANVEQMATLIRMLGGTPDERGGVRRALAKTQAGIASRFGMTRTLQAMRAAETELITQYSEAVVRVDGLAKRAIISAGSSQPITFGTTGERSLSGQNRGVIMAAKLSSTKRMTDERKSELGVSYNEFKEYEGQRYEGRPQSHVVLRPR